MGCQGGACGAAAHLQLPQDLGQLLHARPRHGAGAARSLLLLRCAAAGAALLGALHHTPRPGIRNAVAAAGALWRTAQQRCQQELSILLSVPSLDSAIVNLKKTTCKKERISVCMFQATVK